MAATIQLLVAIPIAMNAPPAPKRSALSNVVSGILTSPPSAMAFGARTGGSVILYGAFYVVIGLFFGGSTEHVIRIFPQPVLGIILLFEARLLMSFLRDTANDQRAFLIALLVATAAMTLPQGFAIGFVAGTLLHYLPTRYTFPT